MDSITFKVVVGGGDGTISSVV